MEMLFMILFILYFLFDVNYFLRTILVVFYVRLKRRLGCSIDILEESTSYGICFTKDMDFQLHMNNARYLRNCDFARFDFLTLSDLYKSTRLLKSRLLVGASKVRYRRSIEFLDIYRIHTRILCWDDRAFYVEQRFERRRDDFINALIIIKLTVTGPASPQSIVDGVRIGITSPAPLPEISKWIESIALSSERLRKDL